MSKHSSSGVLVGGATPPTPEWDRAKVRTQVRSELEVHTCVDGTKDAVFPGVRVVEGVLDGERTQGEVSLTVEIWDLRVGLRGLRGTQKKEEGSERSHQVRCNRTGLW